MATERRLIDANKLMVRTINTGTMMFPRYEAVVPVEQIEAAPIVDAVEVVRCKDCEWFNKAGCAIYIVDDTDKPKEGDFCSFGQRRTDNER